MRVVWHGAQSPRMSPMDQGVRDHLRAFYDGETPERVGRPLTEERADRRDAFIHELTVRGARSVLDVGCGPGRDGAALDAAGLAYTGVDLSPVAVRMCREQGLTAREADATSLPFADDSVDAVWSMSTLMHLPGDGFGRALGEMKRVVRPGGLVEIGVWGDVYDNERPHPVDGRYFRRRTDDTLRAELECFGPVVDFDTWAWSDDGVHYQWARVVTS